MNEGALTQLLMRMYKAEEDGVDDIGYIPPPTLYQGIRKGNNVT